MLNLEKNISYSNELFTISSDYDTAKIFISNDYITQITTKFGTTKFEYDKNGLVIKITDDNNVIKFEYYDSPYRIKSVTRCSLDGQELCSYNYAYSYNTTSITDSKNMKKVISFNNMGNSIGTVLYDNNLNEAYGYNKTYVENPFNSINNNNVKDETPPIKYVENLLNNSSFEPSDIQYNFDIGEGYPVNGYARTGEYSLLFNSKNTFEYLIPKADTYTISFYIKKRCDGKATLYENINGSLTKLSEKNLKDFDYNIYTRYNLTGNFTSGSKLVLEITLDDEIDAYIDDIQLETGNVANSYNLIDNGDFSKGTSNWLLPEGEDAYEMVDLGNGTKAIKINSNPENEYSLSMNFNISGFAGDVYNLSFWYKNEGVFDNSADSYTGNTVNLQFSYPDDYGSGTDNYQLNRHSEEWQFFTKKFVTDSDYNGFMLNILSLNEANSLYLTKFMLVQNLGTIENEYDSEGNLIWESELSQSYKEYKFNENNQMIGVFDQKGNNLCYEYDSKVKDRLLRGMSPTGLTNEYVYDNNGKIVKYIVNNHNFNLQIEDGTKYYIRANGTNKYISFDHQNYNLIIDEDDCNHDYFEFIKSDDYYNIKYVNSYLSFNNNKLTLTNLKDDSVLFKVIKNVNGSFSILPKNNENISLDIKDGELLFSYYDKMLETEQFYLENCKSEKQLVKKVVYNDTGKYVNKVIDELGKVQEYNVDENTGLRTKYIDANGVITDYVYDSKNRISEIKSGDYTKKFTYSNNVLQSIKSNNKNYNLEYNNLLQNTAIKLNDKLLTSKEYNKYGQLLKTIYANNSETLSEYDNFNRTSSISKYGKKFNYYYDNLGKLSKITSGNEIYEYQYDFAERLKEFIYNNYRINYNYDENNNITEQRIFFEGKEFNLKYIYDKNDVNTKIVINNSININYNYDELSRLKSKNVNDNIPCEFEYYSNGQNTSYILKSITINNDIYKYDYDNNYNIIRIYLNNDIINEYEYDEMNELVYEKDYNNDTEVYYKYDLSGNIIERRYQNLAGSVERQDIFSYENPDWEDQLTSYNNEEIVYDELGNIIKYGNKTFKWDGVHLVEYNDGINKITYKYNNEDLIIKKTVNNNSTDYYYDNGLLVYEKNSNGTIHYIYDSIGDLIGFEYQDKIYYYKKNHLEDIIGIYDNSYNQIVTYKYDSWGSVTILDKDNKEITNKNNIGLINPYRYRSYYYDNDLNLYWLKNRYYNPEFCRFINIDCQLSDDLLGDNLYIYCGNNPINRTDESGKFWFVVGRAAIGGLLSGLVKICSNAVQHKKLTEGLVGAVVSGAVVGALSTVGLGIVGSALIGSATNAVIDEALNYTDAASWNSNSKKKQLTSKNIKESAKSVAIDTAVNTGASCLGSVFASFVGKSLGITDVGRPPKKFIPSFFGKKAQKFALVTAVDTTYSDFVGGFLSWTVDKVQQVLYNIY